MTMAPASAQIVTPANLKALTIEQLMDIEVTSVSRRPEKLSETASAIQVVTSDEIRRSGATSIPEALRLASNLEVAQIDSRQWAISARGFNATTSNKMLVLIDGRSIYTPLYAGVFWDAQDTLLEDVDRIEVISGPGATAWGANAVNGVINVTTKSAQATQGLLLLGGGGTELRGFGGVRYGGQLAPGVSYRVYGKYSERDNSAIPGGQDAADDWHFGQGGFRVDWDASDATNVTLQGDAYGGRISQAAGGDTVINGRNIVGRWTRRFSAKSDFKLQLYHDRTHREIPGMLTQTLNTYDVDFQHRFPVGDTHDVVWGLGTRVIHDNIGNSPALAFLPARVTRETYSGFIQDEIALLDDQVHLTFGSKVEHNDYTGVEFQPSVRATWALAAKQTVWSAVSRAVRTPSRIDREAFVPGIPPFTVLEGGRNFDSEKLVAYELGYRVEPTSQLALAVAAYYNDYEDLRSIERISPPAAFPVVIGNGLRGESSGVELSASFQASEHWRLRAGFTELNIDLRKKPESTDASPGSSESHDVNHQFFLRSALDLTSTVDFDASYRYVAGVSNQGVPAYDELDVRIAWRPTPGLELSIVGQNLLHRRHAEFNPSGTRREIERSAYAKAVWSF